MTRPLDFLPHAQEAYEQERMRMRIYPISKQGVITTATPLARFDEMILLSANEQTSDRTQVVLSSDAPKLYAFGREHRFFNYQGLIIDTDLEEPMVIQENNQISSWTGHAYTQWQYFYRLAKLSDCAQNKRIVSLTYASKRLFGAITQAAVSHDATRPHEYALTFSFYVTHSEDIDV